MRSSQLQGWTILHPLPLLSSWFIWRNVFKCTQKRPSRSEICSQLPVPGSPRSSDSYHPSEDEENPNVNPVTSHEYNLRKLPINSRTDENKRVYNFRSWDPIPDLDPEIPVKKTIHATEPESGTEETTTKKIPRVKKVKGKISCQGEDTWSKTLPQKNTMEVFSMWQNISGLEEP